MAKPHDIPQHVWDQAKAINADMTWTNVKETIARAIMAAKAEEREACAAALEAEAFGNPVIVRFATMMAANIRKRGEAA